MAQTKKIPLLIFTMTVLLVLTIVWSISTPVTKANEQKISQVYLPMLNAPWVVPDNIMNLFAALPISADSPNHLSTPERIHLGNVLFFDARLSINESTSCYSCHQLHEYGTDGLPTSKGHDGNHVDRNAPSVYNAAFNFVQFWDGRAVDLEDQAGGPILAANEMGMPSEEYVEQIISAIPDYQPLFAAAYPDEANPITFYNLTEAIGLFERTLIIRSRFDDFMEGDTDALSDAEKQGMITFVDVGCATCHSGASLGGDSYQKMGVTKPYPTTDLGRYDITGEEADKYVFKVPQLRQITETGPYLHDGSLASLEETVRIMAEYELGIILTDDEVGQIMAFMEALTGPMPERFEY